MKVAISVTRTLWAAVVLALLGACSSGDQYADLRAFMKEVEAKPKGSIAELPEFSPYQPFSYGAANLRSPFEPPIVIPPQTEEQRVNIGVRPPQDHVRQYLERFNIASLTMVGTLQQDNSTWALIEDGQKGVHRVQVGDYLGTNFGRIESIDDTRIDITEIVGDGQGCWLRRPRTIELSGLSDQ